MLNKKQKEAELEQAGAPVKTAEIISNQAANKAERGDAPVPHSLRNEDKRETARQEHSHFTNRADSKGQ